MQRLANLLLACLMTVLLTVTACAQDTAVQKWSTGVVSVGGTYSGDGTTLHMFSNLGVRSLSLDTGKLALVPAEGMSFAAARTGAGFYFATQESPSKTYYYNAVTRTSKLIKNDAAGYSGANALALSKDGTKLALKTWHPGNNRFYVVIFNSSTGAQLGRIPLPVDFWNSGLEFCHGDNRILVGGTRLYPASGTSQTAIGTVVAGAYALSPDGTKMYGLNAGMLGAFDLTATSGIPTLWNVPTNAWTLQTTADGKALVSTALAPTGSPNYILNFYSTVDGSLLPGSIPLTGMNNAPLWIAMSPSTNELVLQPWDNYIARFSFDTTTGTGTRLPDLARGFGGSALQTFGTVSTPYVSFLPHAAGPSAKNVVHDATSGAKLGEVDSRAIFSPSGMYFGFAGERISDGVKGVHIYRSSDNAHIATIPDTFANAFGWANDGRFWMGRSSDTNVDIYDLSVMGPTLVRTFNGIRNGKTLMSANGFRIVDFQPSQVKVYNVVTGNQVGTVNPGTATFINAVVVQNRLMIHEWVPNGSMWTNRVTFRNLLSGPLFIEAQTGYDSEQDAFGNYGQATPSSDCSFVVFTRQEPQKKGVNTNMTRVIRTYDWLAMKTFDTQLGDMGFESVKISSDNATLVTASSFNHVIMATDLPLVLGSVSVNPNYLAFGQSAVGTVTVSRPAPTGGISVTLETDPGVVIPPTVTIPAGATSVDFPVHTTITGGIGTRWIYATYDGVRVETTLSLSDPSEMTMTFNPSSVDGGYTSTGTITLNGLAGPDGATVRLSSNKPFVTVPATVFIPAGQSTKTFTATTTDPGSTQSAQVTAAVFDAMAYATLEIRTVGITVIFDQPSIVGGNALLATVTLSSPAPPGGAVLTLTGDAVITPLATITILEGSTTATAGIDTKPVGTDTTGTLTATRGAASGSAQATITTAKVLGVYSADTSVTGNKVVKGVVVLTGRAPDGGLSIALSSNNTSLTVPATVTVPAGQHVVTFDMNVKRTAAPKTVTITAGGKKLVITLKRSPG